MFKLTFLGREVKGGGEQKYFFKLPFLFFPFFLKFQVHLFYLVLVFSLSFLFVFGYCVQETVFQGPLHLTEHFLRVHWVPNSSFRALPIFDISLCSLGTVRSGL